MNDENMEFISLHEETPQSFFPSSAFNYGSSSPAYLASGVSHGIGSGAYDAGPCGRLVEVIILVIVALLRLLHLDTRESRLNLAYHCAEMPLEGLSQRVHHLLVFEETLSQVRFRLFRDTFEGHFFFVSLSHHELLV